jgi:hypothetical protein
MSRIEGAGEMCWRRTSSTEVCRADDDDDDDNNNNDDGCSEPDSNSDHSRQLKV